MAAEPLRSIRISDAYSKIRKRATSVVSDTTRQAAFISGATYLVSALLCLFGVLVSPLGLSVDNAWFAVSMAGQAYSR